jgi:hypothetical protein
MGLVFAPGVFYAPAGADLSAAANLGKYVKMSTTTVVLCDTAGEASIGVLANLPALGDPAEVHCGRVTKVRAGGVLAVGSMLKTTTAGKAAAASLSVVNTADAGGATDPVIGSHCMGILHEAATADGDLVTAWVAPCGAIPTTIA